LQAVSSKGRRLRRQHSITEFWALPEDQYAVDEFFS
jgi:hypothetical protein